MPKRPGRRGKVRERSKQTIAPIKRTEETKTRTTAKERPRVESTRPTSAGLGSSPAGILRSFALRPRLPVRKATTKDAGFLRGLIWA
jgi:hypothetical protein